MPYADREQQLAYQRIYMKRRRAVKQIAKLLKEGEKAKTLYENNNDSCKSFYGRWLSDINEKLRKKMAVVQECDGLLKNVTKLLQNGGDRKP